MNQRITFLCFHNIKICAPCFQPKIRGAIHSKFERLFDIVNYSVFYIEMPNIIDLLRLQFCAFSCKWKTLQYQFFFVFIILIFWNIFNKSSIEIAIVFESGDQGHGLVVLPKSLGLQQNPRWKNLAGLAKSQKLNDFLCFTKLGMSWGTLRSQPFFH